MAKMGRPPKRPADRQSEKVTVKFTPGERRRVDAEARKAGLPLGTWLRREALKRAKGG